MPVFSLKIGSKYPNRPESCVDLVEATTIDLSCAVAWVAKDAMTAATNSSDRLSTKILRGLRLPREMHSASSALGAFKHVSVGLIYDTFVYELNLTQVELRLQSICMIEIETYCNTVTSAFLKRRRVWGNATITRH